MAEERILIRQNPKGIESQTRFVDVIMYLLNLRNGLLGINDEAEFEKKNCPVCLRLSDCYRQVLCS